MRVPIRLVLTAIPLNIGPVSSMMDATFLPKRYPEMLPLVLTKLGRCKQDAGIRDASKCRFMGHIAGAFISKYSLT